MSIFTFSARPRTASLSTHTSKDLYMLKRKNCLREALALRKVVGARRWVLHLLVRVLSGGGEPTIKLNEKKK